MEGEAVPKIQKISLERILTWTFFLVIITVVIITFFKYFVIKDYIIQAEANCDPMTEECFIYECVPGTDADCADDPEDPEAMLSYYKIVEKKAFLIPDCDPNNENCDALNCQGQDEENCKETFCSDETKEKGTECVDPTAYSAAHPEEEEEGDSVDSDECDPESDEDCVESEEEGSEECAPDDGNCSSDASSEDSSSEDIPVKSKNSVSSEGANN
jgi:hypothetical protein